MQTVLSVVVHIAFCGDSIVFVHCLLLQPMCVGVWYLYCNVVIRDTFSFAVASQRKRELVASLYTTLTNFSIKYLVMCKVYTDVGGIK